MADKESLNQSQVDWQQIFLNMENARKQHHACAQKIWLQGVDEWWKTQPGNVSESANSLYCKLMFSSRFFINFIVPFESSEESTTDPVHVLVNYLEVFLEAIEKSQTIHLETNEKIKGFWALPLAIWQQQINGLKGFPDSFFQFAEHHTADDKDSTEFTQAYRHYLQALQNYQSAYVSMTIDAATDLMQQLQNKNSQHNSTQKICTLWIELFENYYADFVSNNDYSLLYAEVINSWMLLIQQTKQLITPCLTAMKMPVEDDMDALKARQKALLDENLRLQEQLAACINKD